MPIIIDSQAFDLYDRSIKTLNHVQNASIVRRNEAHCSKRTRYARAIVVHTVHGTADGSIIDDIDDTGVFSPSDADLKYAKYQANTTRSVSWHFTIDTDGSIVQSYDPATEVCWHANQTNPFTVGFELVQRGRSLTATQMHSFVELCDLLTGVGGPRMAIPRVIYMDTGVILDTLTENNSGARVCGIYGHRNIGYRKTDGAISRYRGDGDPGKQPFQALIGAGYAMVSGATSRTWLLPFQKSAGVPQDGIYGPATRDALAKKSLAFGTMNDRPIDSILRSKAVAG